MGLLGRLFGGDPQKDLDKARELLTRDPAKALALARRHQDGERSGAAAELVQEARDRLIEKALDTAREVEESEFYEDAVEWLERALEQIEDPAQRQEIEARRGALLAKIAEAEEEGWDEPVQDEDAVPFDESAQLDAVFDMMHDDIAPLYREQGEVFRSAVSTLLEGRPADALESLDALAEESPEDPALRLERGRCRLLVGDAAGARDDFAAAWESLGDTPLFAGRAESAPGLWADAQIATGDPAPVLERLEELADPDRGRTDLTIPYATALVAAGDSERSEAFLRQALRRMPNVADLSFLYAGVQVALGDRDSAIVVLESVIAPACATGNCSPKALHMPSLRALIGLHEEQGNDARVRELSLYLGTAEGQMSTDHLQAQRVSAGI
ncbi:MAG: tetratricopeptide repeat protein [Acidobacteriota bacterium]